MAATVSRYTIVLEMRYRGSACGSTNDIIEAVSAQEAIDKAISEWKKVEPGFTFAPLFSAPLTLGQPVGQP